MPQIVIADAGGSKTCWRTIANDGQITQAVTAGFNPLTSDGRAFVQECQKLFAAEKVASVYFYAAGVTGKEAESKTLQVLKQVFGETTCIKIHSDLLAAARATCLNSPGIACILGTGANSCFYDGDSIVQRVPSLGYILGDEGSGAYLGKQLLSAYFRGRLARLTSERLAKRFELKETQVLQKVYSTKEANKYLASFGRFMLQNLGQPDVYQIVYDGFARFFDEQLTSYSNLASLPVHFVGGTAFYFSNVLRKVAEERSINLQKILENPTAGLALYHQ